MKSYKIRIPERNRERIHHLLQTHAFELGYWWYKLKGNKVTPTYTSYLYLNADGMIGFGDFADFFHSKKEHQEIAWNEFLLLTKEDVKNEKYELGRLREELKHRETQAASMQETIRQQKEEIQRLSEYLRYNRGGI